MTFKVVEASRLMDNCRVSLPGALDGAIQQELFNVLDDFFNFSDIWYEDIPLDVTGEEARGDTVTIDPSEGRINRLLYVCDANNNRRHMTMPIPGELLFVDVPGQAAEWTVRCAINVADPVPDGGALAGFPLAPDWILTKYLKGLSSGVMANMMVQVGKPYTNPKMALVHMAQYRRTLGEARMDARRQNLFSGQAWSFPAFAG